MYHINNHLSSLLFAKNVLLSNYNSDTFSASKSLVSRQLIGKLINQYWQEKIFLSNPNLYTEKYINQLKLEGILVCKNEQKKFLLDFSRALLSGRIETSLNFGTTKSNNNQYISYIWKKGFNFSLPTKLLLFNSDKSYLNTEQITFANQLYNQALPLFTVINNMNQMILTDSSEENIGNLNSIDKIYKWYYDKLVSNEKILPIYYGLFFVEPKDALEYVNYIKSKYPNSSKIKELSLFPSHLSTYYKVTRMNLQNLQFRLIPDLEEISRLLCKYRYYKNVTFHKYQKYSKNFFQGQPLYIIEPFFAYERKTNKLNLLNYSFDQNSDIHNKSIKYEAIFTKYATLIEAWHKFRQKKIDYKIPNKPKVIVYNLEDFIRNNEHNDVIKEKNILFIPSKESYKFIKHYKFINNQNKMRRVFSNKFLLLKILSQRILWSLTSRQPVNW
uniref:Ycf80 n=1 Tax=Gracilaria firma TaxID=2510791 RepID=A0A2Z2JIS7_9FLOR|nr:Ycf80 [Gracilaria changii]ART65193.1 Ycf80 [Gracilaria changii]